MNEEKILIIEDDGSIREGVRILMEAEGYHVEEAENGYAGIKIVKDTERAVDLILLDIMMPGLSGIKTCQEIRKISNAPILFLTAKDQEADKLMGLMAGGDDYLVKPFSYVELLGRVKALLRRYKVYNCAQHEKKNLKWVISEKLKLCTEFNEVWIGDEEVNLTEIEYKILRLMIQNPQKIFSIQNLYESLWEEPFVYTSANTVMVHIRKLRIKIEADPQKPQIIQTVWGKGYRFGRIVEKKAK